MCQLARGVSWPCLQVLVSFDRVQILATSDHTACLTQRWLYICVATAACCLLSTTLAAGTTEAAAIVTCGTLECFKLHWSCLKAQHVIHKLKPQGDESSMPDEYWKKNIMSSVSVFYINANQGKTSNTIQTHSLKIPTKLKSFTNPLSHKGYLEVMTPRATTIQWKELYNWTQISAAV